MPIYYVVTDSKNEEISEHTNNKNMANTYLKNLKRTCFLYGKEFKISTIKVKTKRRILHRKEV